MKTLAAQAPGSDSPDRVPLPEALSRADFVSLHCPLTPLTRGFVNGDFLCAMKPGAILLNTGRGPLVDEAALAEALASGHLGGLGLDVLSVEPPAPGHPLLDPSAPWAERVVVTPHIGWATIEARRRLIGTAIANVKSFFAQQAPSA
jgi:glycerate dehydrogenase